MSKKQSRSRLEKLQNSWSKADADMRREFLRWLVEAGHLAESADGMQSHAPIASGRYLTSQVKKRIEHIMVTRCITMGDVMVELGFARSEMALLRALARKASLRLKMVAALERWLAEHRHV